MNSSESTKALANALKIFQVKAGKIIKRAENPFFKSKYADLPSILDEIALPLDEAGLVITQWPDGDGLTTVLMHPESGEWMSANATMHPVKSDPQSVGSAITFQRRYSIVAILALNCDEDDDGNKASEPKKEEPNQVTTDLPWLNMNTPEFEMAKSMMDRATDKVAAIKALRSQYKISNKVAEALK